MNASYNASIRCVNFSVTFFFHRALLWNMDCSIFWMWRLIARFQWLFKRPRRWTNGEHWVHVQNKSTDHICSLLSRFSFVLQRNFSHTKIFEDVFRYALWLAVFTAIAQPFKISITDDVTSGWVGFFESSWSPGWGSMETILHRCSWRNAFWCQPFPPWPTQASPNKNPRQKGLGRSGWRKPPELELPRRWKFETCLKSRKAKTFNGIKNFATTNGPVCACMRGFYVDVSLTKWIHLGRLMRKSNQDSDGQACCCQAPCTMCIAPW